jgi:peptide/nickel transport system substrate-binding protein
VKSRRWLVLLGCFLVAAMLAVLSASCGGSTPTSEGGGETVTTVGNIPRTILECPQGPPGSETPEYGGTFTIIHNHTPANIGAWWLASGFADWQYGRWAVENLVGLNSKAEPVPQLATAWVVDPVANTVTFTLRQGVKFHDGTDFNAEAVKWNFEMQKNSKEKSDFKDVQTIEVVDPYTVRVTLSQPDALFVKKLVSVSTGQMVSPTAYQTNGEQWCKLHPVGTGPFMLASIEPDVAVKFVKNPNYWQKGLPYLDAVEMQIVADTTTAISAFKSGEGQQLVNLTTTQCPELEALGNRIYTRIMTIVSLAGNSKDPKSPTNDIRVRRAMAYAIDVPTIINGVWGGLYPAINQFAIKDGQGWNPNIKGYPYDPVKAAALAAEAGITPSTPWKTDLFYSTDEQTTEAMTLVQEQLKVIGINVSLKPLAYAARQDLLSNGWNGLLLLPASCNFDQDYATMLQAFLSEDAYQGGQYIYIPEEFNTAYRAAIQEVDAAKRTLAYQELNRMAIDDYCLIIPMFDLGGVTAQAPELKDCGFLVKSISQYSPESIWLKGAKSTATTASPGATSTSGK